MADADADAQEHIRQALERTRCVASIQFVADGRALLDSLRGAGSAGAAPVRPSLILIDLDLPDEDGHDTLFQLKADVGLRRIPVVTLATSGGADEVRRVYDLGASSYITKPASASGQRTMLAHVADYWSRIVTLPDPAYG